MVTGELADEFQVSRSVTREAVRVLAAKGLVDPRPRRGTLVQPESSWNLYDADVLRWMLERSFQMTLLRQFNELRVALEPAAAELAARNSSVADLARIDAGYRRMAAAEAGEDDPLDADIAFHAAVLHASANPFYAQLHDVVGTALRTSVRATNSIAGRTPTIPDHFEVMRAIQARDGAGAHTAMAFLIRDAMLMSATKDAKGGPAGG